MKKLYYAVYDRKANCSQHRFWKSKTEQQFVQFKIW